MPNWPARFGSGAGVTVGAGLGVTVGAEVGVAVAWMGGLARELVWVRAVWARAPAEAHQEKRAAEKAWKETRLRHHLRRRSLASARLLRLPLSIAGWHEKQATARIHIPFQFLQGT